MFCRYGVFAANVDSSRRLSALCAGRGDCYRRCGVFLCSAAMASYAANVDSSRRLSALCAGRWSCYRSGGVFFCSAALAA
ncbi:MAG: hypothetical protein IKX88_02070 [Thermoguttaceae bacterium]|nr:hypothetical protein [Thermoguttaceae bacterium]